MSKNTEMKDYFEMPVLQVVGVDSKGRRILKAVMKEIPWKTREKQITGGIALLHINIACLNEQHQQEKENLTNVLNTIINPPKTL